MSLSLPQLARVVLSGSKSLARLAQEGSLRREHLWIAANGAERYIEAVASGDTTDQAKRAARLAACQRCPSRTGLWPEQFCGPAFVDLTAAVDRPRTCGCLIEGKASVESEACPQGRWGTPGQADGGHPPGLGPP